MTEQKIQTWIKYLFVAIVVLLSFTIVYAYITSDYYNFLQTFLLKVERTRDYEPLIKTDPYFHYIYHPFTRKEFEMHLQNPTLQLLYSITKFEGVLLLAILLFWIQDLVTAGKTRLSRWANRLIQCQARIIYQNIRYVTELPRFTRWAMSLLVLVQGVFLLFFLLHIPFEYDEQMSYFCFSSRGLLQTATFYPFPNNHILYNLAAVLCTYTHLPPQISTRIPSFLACFVATYYLFKLSRRHFSDTLSLIITTLYTISYPVVFYAIMARGYTFMHCFTVLLFYAADGLISEPGNRKYRVLYFLSMTGALYTIPSCIYIMAGMGLAMTTYYLLRRRFKELSRFILDNTGIILVVLVLYLPIILCNGTAGLSNPTDSPKFSPGELVQLSGEIFQRQWDNLARGSYLPSLTILLFIAAAGWVAIRKTAHSFLGWLSVIVLVSPVLVILITRIIPVERVLGYLIVPICLSIGFLLELLIPFIRRILEKTHTTNYYTQFREHLLLTGMILFTCLSFASYNSYHEETRPVVYFSEDLFKKMGRDMDHIHTLRYTQDYYSRYFTQCVLMKCYMLDPNKRFDMGVKTTGPDNDAEPADFEITLALPPATSGSATGASNAAGSPSRARYDSLGTYYFSPYEHVNIWLRRR